MHLLNINPQNTDTAIPLGQHFPNIMGDNVLLSIQKPKDNTVRHQSLVVLTIKLEGKKGLVSESTYLEE